MKIEDQVLSIKQVQELKELGFDIAKHASMEHAPVYDNEFKIVRHYLRVRGTGGSTLVIHPNKEEDVYISTMTIGDIIDILPIEIDEYVLDMNRKYVSYDSKQNSLYYGYRHRFIDSLFDCLVWCIKEKHIKL